MGAHAWNMRHFALGDGNLCFSSRHPNPLVDLSKGSLRPSPPPLSPEYRGEGLLAPLAPKYRGEGLLAPLAPEYRGEGLLAPLAPVLGGEGLGGAGFSD